MLLDLSAAFDSIDRDVLFNRLEKLVGLSDYELNLFKTNIKQRKFFISLGDYVPEKRDISYRVAQGTCLGPLLLSLYMLANVDIIRQHKVCFRSYADNTQHYISVNQITLQL